MLLRLQNEILELIASGERLEATLDHLCRLIEERVPRIACSVLLVQDGLLRPLAGPKLPEYYARALDGIAIGPDVGSCGAAAYLAQPVAVQDILTDAKWAPYRHLIKPLGYRACWSSPIKKADGSVVGTFAFYYEEPRGPSRIERKLVAASIHLCTIAIERHHRAMERHRLAYHDALTGLPNRAAFDRHANQIARDGLGLILLDLDNLKFTNDTFGHRVGDELIKEVAARLHSVTEHLFRLGGDEFAIICEARDIDELRDLAASCLSLLKAPACCGGHTVLPLATAGGALCKPGVTMEVTRHQADLALYHAKDTAKGLFQAFDATVATAITSRLNAIRDVTLALAENRIVPFYQPVVDLRTGKFVGVEALCRIRRQDGSYASAAEFFEAMHDAHIASEITGRMLDKMTSDVTGWRRQGIEIGHIAINVTAADFQTGGLKERLSRFVDRVGIAPRNVIVEVTETVYLEQRANAIRDTISDLRAADFKIALDDFGTGYAALSHLLKVKVDIIKIDRSFTKLMESDSGAAAIVEGMVEIARRMDIEVIAEGVETVSHASLLREMGCILAQGYFYSKAVDARSYAELVLSVTSAARLPS
ncbi:putative bifunctional diguanylate cyclase/phosphodiesterase [Rhizobium sp. BR 315]|uniref:putative bifunctional diguanylate cyclase/phosphodiesterase n=1 Tax=Rhizobium sp. BR 315 TaxID=3040014 RepID=UPI003D34DA15